LWHQLLIFYQADFFQTCIDDQVGFVDDRKEKYFFLRPFLPELWPIVNFTHKIVWHQLHIIYLAEYFKTCTDDYT
jgi:hypothetical protein